MTKNSGFTLLELAIVLAIIGLIAGGVVAGSSLIRAGEIRQLLTEASEIRTAVFSFKEKYNELPGDMQNATRFWGAVGTCPTGTGSGTETCDGDGDGLLERPASQNHYGEPYTFWQHLNNAGLIDGTYSGKSGSGGTVHSTEENSYKVASGNGVFSVFNLNQTYTGHAEIFDGEYLDNYLQYGGIDPASTTSSSIPLLSPEESWSMDKKIDDGKPASGLYRNRTWDECTDATSSSDLDAEYALSETELVCINWFYNPF